MNERQNPTDAALIESLRTDHPTLIRAIDAALVAGATPPAVLALVRQVAGESQTVRAAEAYVRSRDPRRPCTE